MTDIGDRPGRLITVCTMSPAIARAVTTMAIGSMGDGRVAINTAPEAIRPKQSRNTKLPASASVSVGTKRILEVSKKVTAGKQRH